MVAYYQRDYTIYFETKDIEDLAQACPLEGTVRNYTSLEKMRISLKSNDELDLLSKRTKGRTTFSNEALLAVIHWVNDDHEIFLDKKWFLEITKQDTCDRTIRWGDGKLTILSGESRHSKHFKENFC